MIGFALNKQTAGQAIIHLQNHAIKLTDEGLVFPAYGFKAKQIGLINLDTFLIKVMFQLSSDLLCQFLAWLEAKTKQPLYNLVCI